MTFVVVVVVVWRQQDVFCYVKNIYCPYWKGQKKQEFSYYDVQL
jgi:hypothetical protein